MDFNISVKLKIDTRTVNIFVNSDRDICAKIMSFKSSFENKVVNYGKKSIKVKNIVWDFFMVDFLIEPKYQNGPDIMQFSLNLDDNVKPEKSKPSAFA